MTTYQNSLAGLPKALRIESDAPVRSLRRNFQWTIVGNAVYACTQWGILVLLAHLGDALFDYDKSAIRSDAATALKDDVQAISAIPANYPSEKLRIEGHCDAARGNTTSR